MMREEMRETPLESGDPVQHSHDFFVISSCSVQGRLVPGPPAGDGRLVLSPPAGDSRLVRYGGLEVPAGRLVGDVEASERILRRFGLNLHGMPVHGGPPAEKVSYVPLQLDPEQVYKDLREGGAGEGELEDLRTLVSLVEAGRELGITKAGLREAGGIPRDRLVRSLTAALEKCLVLEVGILEPRFVSHRYSRDWLIHSYKLNRVRDLEKMQNMKQAGKLYQGHGPREPEKVEAEAEKVKADKPKSSDDGEVRRSGRKRTVRRGSLDEAVGGEDISVDHRTKNPQVYWT